MRGLCRWIVALVVVVCVGWTDGQAVGCSNEEAIGSPLCPRLFLLGAQKCGTTSFYLWMQDRFPQLVVPVDFRDSVTRVKEVHFFDLHYEKGLQWYLSFFPVRNNSMSWAMDATPAYFRFHLVPSRLQATLGHLNPKFILMFRDPIDRAFSWYKHVMEQYLVEVRAFKNVYDAFDHDFYKLVQVGAKLVSECTKLYGDDNKFFNCAMDSPRWVDAQVVPPGKDTPVRGLGPLVQLWTDGLYANILLEWYKFFSPEDFCVMIYEHMVVDLASEFSYVKPCIQGVTKRTLRDDMNPNDKLIRSNVKPCPSCPPITDEQMLEIRDFTNSLLFRESNTLLREILRSQYGRTNAIVWENH